MGEVVSIKHSYCFSAVMVNVNHNWLMFNPANLNITTHYYQQQVLVARFYGFVRNVSFSGVLNRRSIELQWI